MRAAAARQRFKRVEVSAGREKVGADSRKCLDAKMCCVVLGMTASDGFAANLVFGRRANERLP